MYLCFGVFVKILKECINCISQTELVARLTIVVDPKSRYLGNEWSNPEVDKSRLGDKITASKLTNCKLNFNYSAGIPISIADEKIIKQFAENVSPFIDEDLKEVAILALLDLIRRDKSIECDNRETFKKVFGVYRSEILRQSEFYFSDFLCKILIYTTLPKISNTLGESCVNKITKEYVNTVAEVHTSECQWDQDKQVLVFVPTKIFEVFQCAYLEFQIGKFVENMDPSVHMHIDWIEKCENFIKYIEAHIFIPYAQCEKAKGICQIKEFSWVLNEYLLYLEKRMRPLVYDDGETVDYMVSIYRIGQEKDQIEFRQQALDYRQRLVDIYGDIYRCLSPDIDHTDSGVEN